MSRASIPSYRMACLPTLHHPMLHTRLMRMSTISLPYPLRANNPSPVMHMSFNLWGRHMQYPETTLWPILSLTSDMPLRGKHMVAYPCQMLCGALSIALNHKYNPYILRWKDCLLPWWKFKLQKYLISMRKMATMRKIKCHDSFMRFKQCSANMEICKRP